MKSLTCSKCNKEVCGGKYKSEDGKVWSNMNDERASGAIQIPVFCKKCT